MSGNDLSDDHIIKVSFLVSRRKEPHLHAWLSDKRFKNTSEAIRTLMRVGMATIGPAPNAAFVATDAPAPRQKPAKRAAAPRPAPAVVPVFFPHQVPVPAVTSASVAAFVPPPVEPVVQPNPAPPSLVSEVVQALAAPHFSHTPTTSIDTASQLDQEDLSAAMDALGALDRMF